ncbi:Ca2 Cation Antiporter (CaCA)-like protein [Aureococcus anophagefferens]|nr:Ca2 Cation Antiporter (CaCA)-like protein [Aureococcus anophagefferens]
MGFFIDPEECSSIQILQLFAAYAYLMYIGCSMISDGAELLMLTPYSKLVGSCILPVLGAVPDGALVLFSGLGPDAQENLDVGVGALAGSTVMLITIPWALAIWGGRVDADDRGRPRYGPAPRLSEGNVWNSAVSVGAAGAPAVRTMARWMALTALPYVIIEVGALLAAARLGDDVAALSLAESGWALTALVCALLGFLAYLRTQYRAAFAGHPVLESRTSAAAVRSVRGRGLGIIAALEPHLAAEKHDARSPLVDAEAPSSGAPVSSLVKSVLLPFYARYDADGSGVLSLKELSKVFEDMNEPKDAKSLEATFAHSDCNRDGVVDFPEFCRGMVLYAAAKKRDEAAGGSSLQRQTSAARRAPAPVADDDDDEDEEVPDEFVADKYKSIEDQQAAIRRAAMKLCGLGTALVLTFSDPVVDVLNEAGARSGVNAFYVSFVVAPIITNGSEVLASYTFALKKTQKSMVVAYEQLLGAAVMNNTYCLLVFLAIIYFQKLYWKYTAETLAILAAEACTALAVLSLFPATIALVYVLETFVGLA